MDISSAAIERIKQLNAQRGYERMLRVAVDAGGCSGLQYSYEFVKTSNADDEIIERDGVKLALDPISKEYLVNCTLNFVSELGSSYFSIDNPRATKRCGCGQSFDMVSP
ncbi:Iron-sulfur cluster insertion protein ErpA [Rickettsiales endosymbiont of Paramecium tredecaurelia]|uniref:HesB/IscA family protein n=1 Tax=Candidatus Sarmatiella mevalonica TaxID=2770581 RepID=UPI0019246939|nr:iron-sulfur cluster assembly accessory protein [Candidatus Sarmatiella mevalonica]MBL3284289.1 Iron-sulfur cluster insertion protein ErpA [Candidatus Sarmatiella mevalonica]